MKPKKKESNWKQEFAKEAEKALEHDLAQSVEEEFADNLKHNPDVAIQNFDSGLFRYGFSKCMMYVAIVARAQALGIEPDLLRLTPSEATEQQLQLAEAAARAGKPVFIVEREGELIEPEGE